MKPKHLLLFLAVALFAACKKTELASPILPDQSTQIVKFASIVGKWLLTGSARTTIYYTNAGRDSTIKTDSLYSFKQNSKYTINTYTDKNYSTQDYLKDGTSEYPPETANYSISGNTITYNYPQNNFQSQASIITLDDKILQVSETNITADGDKSILTVSFRKQ